MNKKLIITLSLIIFGFYHLQADEGMWLPVDISQFLYKDMKEMGLELTPEQIYSINNSSIKDAIVSLGGFCTGEIVSRQGLLLTNHHCAESVIQSHSSVENDYLENGFWAQTMEDELPNEDLYARFLVSMEDVTQDVLKDITDEMTEEERERVVRNIIEELVTEAEKDSFYDADIKAFYEGNKYYLFLYETYKDVRLVGAPPMSIGNYGGETDNWMWPRHTGDFALFRVYMSPDGKPAAYSPENIPLKPKHHLPISLNGYKKGDFSMILGFPGTTKRYITSYGLNLAVEQTNPDLIEIMQERQGILKKDMDQNEEVNIKYHSKYFRISNALKYYIGQTKGIEELNVIAQRKKVEDDFQEWIEKRNKREKLYGDVINNIKTAYDSLSNYNTAYNYSRFSNYLIEIIPFSYSFASLNALLDRDSVNTEKLNSITEGLIEYANEYYDDYNAPTDRKVFAALMKLYHENVKEDLQPEVLTTAANQYNGDFARWAGSIFRESIFSDKERLMNFLENPEKGIIENDPAFKVAQSFIQSYQILQSDLDESYSKLNRARRNFIKGLMAMNEDKNYYPDANSTLRISYGKITGYDPKDAVHYRYYTTMEGLAAKHDPLDDEFDAPEKLMELYKDQDFGRYDQNGIMEVDFLSNNDITGGNSGSPVLNGRGELIGIAFDGNWEAMSSDIAYQPAIQRTISVDIRYVLFVIDKFADAGHLIDEMTLVTSKQGEPEPELTPTN